MRYIYNMPYIWKYRIFWNFWRIWLPGFTRVYFHEKAWNYNITPAILVRKYSTNSSIFVTFLLKNGWLTFNCCIRLHYIICAKNGESIMPSEPELYFFCFFGKIRLLTSFLVGNSWKMRKIEKFLWTVIAIKWTPLSLFIWKDTYLT